MNETTSACDVIVIGGGVIGLSIAWELAAHGASVRVLDQGLVGQEASWAGAGILPPGNPAQAGSLEARLRAASHVLWEDWSTRLKALTGIDNGFHRCGGVSLCESAADLEPLLATWQAEGVRVERLDPAALRERVPALNPTLPGGLFLPDLGQVRNPRHLKALVRACYLERVEIQSGCPVIDFVQSNGRVTAVRTPAGDIAASEFIIASGAWSRTLLQRAGWNEPLEPVRGQIVLLESRRPLFHHVLEVGLRYLVPRTDGRILIGSTEERAGFEKRTTARGIESLIRFAQELVPALGEATLERCWAGLRPHRPGGLPAIGRVPGLKNLIVAAGHFRAGLQLSPVTATLVRRLLAGEPIDDWVSELAPGNGQVQTTT